MESAYAALYRDLYERHWWWRAREAMLVEEIRRIAPPGGFGPILDVGCGDGLFFGPLREFGTPQGVEPDASLVRAGAPDIYIGSLEAFRPATRFGLIVMADVLEHAQDDDALLARSLELLRDDGAIVVTVPALPILWTAHDDANQHYRRYTRRTLRALAARVGARIERLRDWFRWTVPLRLAAKAASAGKAISTIPRPPVNGLLERISRADYRFSAVPILPGSTLFAILTHSRCRKPSA